MQVTATRDAEWARIVVRDSGEGIERAALSHIFDRFHQEESARRRPEGLGLGLAIVKYFVEAHGGAVSAESDGHGEGAAFTVELLLA